MLLKFVMMVAFFAPTVAFGMKDVPADAQLEAWGKDGLPESCCAICFEKVNSGRVRDALSCWQLADARIKCSKCTAIYHRKCLQKWFAQDNELARTRQCVRRCGAVLLNPTFMQRFKKWCRKHIVALHVLCWADLVFLSLEASFVPIPWFTIAIFLALLPELVMGTYSFCYPDAPDNPLEGHEYKLLVAVSAIGALLSLGAMGAYIINYV